MSSSAYHTMPRDQTCGPYCSYRLYCCIPYLRVLTFMPSKVQLPGLQCIQMVLALSQGLIYMPNQLPGPFMPFFSSVRCFSYICFRAEQICFMCTLHSAYTFLLFCFSALAILPCACSGALIPDTLHPAPACFPCICQKFAWHSVEAPLHFP